MTTSTVCVLQQFQLPFKYFPYIWNWLLQCNGHSMFFGTIFFRVVFCADFIFQQQRQCKRYFFSSKWILEHKIVLKEQWTWAVFSVFVFFVRAVFQHKKRFPYCLDRIRRHLDNAHNYLRDTFYLYFYGFTV